MKERIKQIIDSEDITPAKFADMLQINRAVISHILNGRNNPSLDVASKILLEMPYIDPTWLLNGIGEMYKDGYEKSHRIDKGLFNEELDGSADGNTNDFKAKGSIVNKVFNSAHSPKNEQNILQKGVVKKIRQIIIYYDDNTFETFVMDK